MLNFFSELEKMIMRVSFLVFSDFVHLFSLKKLRIPSKRSLLIICIFQWGLRHWIHIFGKLLYWDKSLRLVAQNASYELFFGQISNGSLSAFDVIGSTERELQGTILLKMKQQGLHKFYIMLTILLPLETRNARSNIVVLTVWQNFVTKALIYRFRPSPKA